MNDVLRQKYGNQVDDISEIVLTTEQIQQRVAELGQAISRDYLGLQPVVVGVLKGVLFFMADLLRSITIPLEMDILAVSSYSTEVRNMGYVRLLKDLDIPINGRHVLFVEDVVDTGLTLNYLLKNLRDRNPASLEVCVIFNKPGNRFIETPLKYKGFDLPDRFVVGYGLDYREKYRNLPFVGMLKPQVFSTSGKE
jgi:hypoxanthine phosphoribosyltransferase